jgi:hypothetical protein
VRRVSAPRDLRVRLIELTSGGRHLVERILAVHDHQVNKVLGGLSAEEQSQLRRLLATWGRHLEGLLEQENPEPETKGSHLVLTGNC